MSKAESKRSGGDFYLMGIAREAILNATPKEVWDGYRESGYTMRQAISEELSYAESARGEREGR